MHTEVFKLIGPNVGMADGVLRNKLYEYQGVQKVSIDSNKGDSLTLTVEYDDTAAGECDDSALFILERDMGMKGVRAEFLKPPPWQLSPACKQTQHADCGGKVPSEYWQTSFDCRCACHGEPK
jgi:hypothetical protein